MTLQPDQPDRSTIVRNEPVSAGADGVFQFNDVAPGSYHIRAVIGTNAFSDWVTEAVPVSVEAGQTTRGVQLTATRGGVLEVTVLGKDDRKPLPHVNVNMFREDFGAAAISDSNGIARLRLLPGDYQVMAVRDSVSSEQVGASVDRRPDEPH